MDCKPSVLLLYELILHTYGVFCVCRWQWTAGSDSL